MSEEHADPSTCRYKAKPSQPTHTLSTSICSSESSLTTVSPPSTITSSTASVTISAVSNSSLPAAPTSSSSTNGLPGNTTVPSCEPQLSLTGASEYAFNGKDTPFSISIANCSTFDVANTVAIANFASVDNATITNDSIFFSGFSADYVLLSVFAPDKQGLPVMKSYQLLFGSVDMPVKVLDPSGQPANGVTVYGNATIYPGVSAVCTTDAAGECTLANLPGTTIALVAKDAANSIAANGLATTTSQVTLQLVPYVAPSGNSTFDASNGTTGWVFESPATLSGRDTSLVVSTSGQYTLQTARKSFNVPPFMKTVYVKYRFITSEVPGGYFGSQYNDYYSVTIRSDTGALVTVTNSMNALGLGAFDDNGATAWYTLTLSVPQNTKSVEYNIGVSNVADNLLDSSVEVQKVGDLQCDDCGDCDSCPSDPMCQDSCQKPQPDSCAFYRNCAEGQLGCGPSGYPISYGEKNCLRFQNNRDWFTSNGQSFITGTMLCLQQAMVPVLKPCDATCESFQSAAFASHPTCYVNNGFCGISCRDVLAVLITVNTDLISKESLKQVVATGAGCVSNICQTLDGCTGAVFDGVSGPALSTVLKIAKLFLCGL